MPFDAEAPKNLIMPAASAATLPAWKRERDACGVIIVTAVDGVPRRLTTERLLEAGNHLSHRGAVAADGKTGDGAGLLSDVPQDFFRRILRENKITFSSRKPVVGQFFMPHDHEQQKAIESIVEEKLRAQGLKVAMWRDVPVETQALGEIALASMPAIRQAIIDPLNANNLKTRLYVAERGIGKAVKDSGIENFYTCSLSSKIIIYKGMALAENLAELFTDLQDPDFKTASGILHQRYSTNTTPSWPRAQPYARGGNAGLAHNGEINTLNGNVNFTSADEAGLLRKSLKQFRPDLLGLIDTTGSDSSQLNDVSSYLINVLDLDPTQVVHTLIPSVDGDHSFAPPWDGPAAIAYTNGSIIGIHADRSGLRPIRGMETNDGFLIAGSETGMVRVDPENVQRRFQLAPGQTVAVDLGKNQIAYPEDVAQSLPAPTKVEYLAFHEASDSLAATHFSPEILLTRQIAAGYTSEELQWIEALATGGEEAISSMGDDTKVTGLERLYELPALRDSYIPLHRLARQSFAQVTNPPIDSLRERDVMNLDVYLQRPSIRKLGKKGNVAIALKSPVLTGNELRALQKKLGEDTVKEIDATFTTSSDPDDESSFNALETALDRIVADAQAAYDKGQRHFVITDEHIADNKFAIPMMLAVSSINKHFIQNGTRNNIGLHARAAEVMDTHGLAMLIACGATTVNPYLAFRTIEKEVHEGRFRKKVTHPDKSVTIEPVTLDEANANYKKGMDKGLLKIMSKMGIGVLASYTGGYNFEMVGLGRDVVDKYMPGVASRIGGYNLDDLQFAAMQIQIEAREHADLKHDHVPAGSRHRAKPGETHKHSTNVGLKELQSSVRNGDYDMYLTYARAHIKVNDRVPADLKSALRKNPVLQPHTLRDLLAIRKMDGTGFIDNPILKTDRPEIPDDVESVEDIVKRYNTGAMSLGALSPEAHQNLTIAMNEIGAKSDCGEGGEANDGHISKIRQVASGRFGVTAAYLAHPDVEELEIKVAQGAKPGEGGQLPGMKVEGIIAKLRHATPGVTLISPPPHHDIYSIEDLAQLIYDLKQINPKAKVAVKLVAQSGIGTIASGVAKAGADVIHVSGNAGGTGAAAVTSLHHAGLPPEIGVADVHQQLIADNLRSRILIRTDGGLKSALDNIKMHMLGADEVGFGTQALIAEGCVMAGVCETNNCPAGVATQDEELRKKFTGQPEHVINFMMFMAQEKREILFAIGANRISEIVGRTDLLEQVDFPNRLDLSELIVPPPKDKVFRLAPNISRYQVPDTLDQRVPWENGFTLPQLFERIRADDPIIHWGSINNTDRTVGAWLAGHLVREFGEEGFSPSQFILKLKGSAGQSLGFGAIRGMEINVTGDANDYVGKALSGGRIIVKPHNVERGRKNQAIIGNTALYGATSGKLFAAGMAGERFAVRNSGGKAVIEGCGNNGCEYMTGGRVIVLGPVGSNFAAGMSGGVAFVHDPEQTFERKLNPGTAISFRVTNPNWQAKLKEAIIEHFCKTESPVAEEILTDWQSELDNFHMVVGKDMLPRYPEKDQPLWNGEQLNAA